MNPYTDAVLLVKNPDGELGRFRIVSRAIFPRL